MATTIQSRRGTTAEHAVFTGAVGEITVDTDKDTVVVHDNLTAGGHPLAKENGSASQAFSVAPATAEDHATQSAQIQSGELVNIVAALTGTEYAATPSPAITSYTGGQTFSVIFDSACPAAPTLALNGIATPPDLVRQNLDGSYETLSANDFPAGWQSPVKMVSATQALVLVLPRITKVVSISRNLTAASGDVAYTGFGATPKSVRLVGGVDTTTISSDGFANSSQKGCTYTNYAGSITTAAFLAAFVSASGNNQTAALSSFTKDTVTLTWTKTSSPTGTVTAYLIAEY